MSISIFLVLLTVSSSKAPSLERVEPTHIAPYQPVSLRLHGSGFTREMRVLIETARRGAFVPHRASDVSSTDCVVDLPLGFGATPATRQLYVQSPDGGRSMELAIHVRRDAPTPEVDVVEAAERADTEGFPMIESLRPSTVPAGRPFVLEVLGRGFAPGATVEILVNLNAGTSRLPEYRPRPFDALHLDATRLEVELDRGFFSVPGARTVVVTYPDGRRSEPATLRIKPQEAPR